jgi:nickel superoxide dismutase
MNKTGISILLAASLLLACPRVLIAHCEIPCGIYDDEMRLSMIEEHITTVEKSMKKIQELSAQDNKNYNQLVRWIDNKETHANYIQDIVYQYFMAQRVEPVGEESGKEIYGEYINKITLLHEMLFYAMKAKQTTDLENVKKLRSLLGRFREVYLGEKTGRGGDKKSGQ